MRRSKPLILFKAVQAVIEEARQNIVRNVNTTMLNTYFEIGRMIVEDEQQGQNDHACCERRFFLFKF